MSEPLVVSARGLAVGYRARRVLAGVDLDVQAGQRWFLLGPNGGGKTTFLRTVLGTLSPRAGVLRRHPTLASRERTGFVPQRCDLNPTLPTTVREFVGLGTVGLRLSRTATRERIATALADVDLPALERHAYWALSGGQRQRALLARALVRRPSLLLLDEPTNHLDLPAGEAFLRLLDGQSRREGTTVLFVTHDFALAARHATHVAIVHDGRIDAGPSREMFARPAVARLLGVEIDLGDDGRVAVRLPAERAS